MQERVSPEPHCPAPAPGSNGRPGGGTGGGGGEARLNKSQLIRTLNTELDELRQEVLKKRRGE